MNVTLKRLTTLTAAAFVATAAATLGVVGIAHADGGSDTSTSQHDDNGDDDADDNGSAPAGGVDTGAGGTLTSNHGSDDDDDGSAPAGGVDTGVGGTAGTEEGGVSSVILLGAGTLGPGAVAGSVLLRRRPEQTRE
ncbi:hypothetical protein FHU33_3590 [Blastococcus colisei]|uniref:Uncharacterized protein n=1 Tax=Blastococcus colisei TaxID=1564162 RepID=A0A543PJ58_9ACTN|nr:hypothetical protein [Blastococcus colisei]TQN44104.1 hypothetical protein FHU33_3590 [Blastococcus colisei]